jgi:hypothetical protein
MIGRGTSASGLMSRVAPVQTAVRNCTRDEGRSFEVGQSGADLKPPQAAVVKAMVVNVAEKSERDSDRQG